MLAKTYSTWNYIEMNLSLDDEKPASRCRMYIIRRACHTASCCNTHALIHYLCQVIAQSVLLLLKQHSRSHWPRGLRCRSVAARLLGLRVRIPSGTWTSVCCECCVLSGRGVCVRLISPRGVLPSVVCVTECHHESSIMRRLLAHWGLLRHGKKKIQWYIHNAPLYASTLCFLFPFEAEMDNFISYVQHTSVRVRKHVCHTSRPKSTMIILE